MAMNWEKNRNARLWRSSERKAYTSPPGASRSATPKQISYLKALMEKNGQPPMSEKDLGLLTTVTASGLIKGYSGK